MADFLAEVYAPRLDDAGLAGLVAQLEAAVDAMAAEAFRVTHLWSIHVPEDETCFHLFEAESAETVAMAGRRAGLTFDRISEAVEPVSSKGGEQ
jgi:hypothetical protein